MLMIFFEIINIAINPYASINYKTDLNLVADEKIDLVVKYNRRKSILFI